MASSKKMGEKLEEVSFHCLHPSLEIDGKINIAMTKNARQIRTTIAVLEHDESVFYFESINVGGYKAAIGAFFPHCGFQILYFSTWVIIPYVL